MADDQHDSEPTVYHYDPADADRIPGIPDTPGVTSGRLVMCEGEPRPAAPAQVWNAAIIVDPDGNITVEIEGGGRITIVRGDDDG
jgi:hypothetical protein